MTFPEQTGGIEKDDLLSGKIRIDVSDDSYEAYAVVNSPDLQFSEIEAALEANGIVYGINRQSCIEALSEVGTRVLIAEGTKHIDGADGFFEETKPREQTESEKKFGLRNIYAGDPVGILHKPTTGSVGIDVFGKKVQPKEGRAINMFTGPTIRRTETDLEIHLEAAADGDLRLGKASIEVVPEQVVRQDIDYSDGELEFAGSLRVTGDVKGSSKLRVKHDVFIQGSVEDAEILAGGNVTVTASFVGRGDGLIRAGKNVEVNVVLNQMIEARETIRIGKESVNARLISGGCILCPGGIIMGGSITAGEKIEVRTLGGELYSTTKVRLGLKELLNADMCAIDKEIELQSKSIEQLKNQVYLLVRDRIDNNNFTAEKADALKALQARLQQQNDHVKELTSRKQEATLELSRKRSPKLTILGTVHQSVAAEINGVRIPLKQSYSNVTFEELKSEIIRTRNL